MSAHKKQKRVTIRDIAKMKSEGRKIVCLTAYTAPVAALMDGSVDLILVGDSLGMVLYGMESTVPVTVDMMIAHGQAVMRGAQQSLVVVDLPFGSYQESPAQAFATAARIMKETGCTAVKLEGGQELAATIEFLTLRGIPVLGHVGLMPQNVNAVGGYRLMGRSEQEMHKIIADAKAVQEAGAFATVLECVNTATSEAVVASVDIPVIGIGASVACAGQILVTDDMIGALSSPPPRFVRQYATVGSIIGDAIAAYAQDVRGGDFPGQAQLYGSDAVDKTLKRAG